jgi:hypothetical protein
VAYFFLLIAAMFWDTPPCIPYVNRLFRGTCHLHLQVRKSAEQETSVHQVPMFLRNVYSHTEYTELYPRRWQHS